MLKLLVKGIDPIPENIVVDCDEEFYKMRMRGDSIERVLLDRIEHATYVSPTTYVNKHGVTLSTEALSTGTKIAVQVHRFPDRIFNGVELGDNALSEILKFCKEGTLVILNERYSLNPLHIDEIDVLYKDYNFKSLQEMSEYMREGFPEDPASYLEWVRCNL